MKLVSREISPSPDRADATRVSVRVRMEKQDRELSYWFDVPARYRAEISESGNPWLVLLTPLAVDSGEDIVLPYPVDPHLRENILGMMRYWNSFFPRLRPVRIIAPEPTAPARPGAKVGLFFSGGVDSTFTLLRHDTAAVGMGSAPADDLLFVIGFDIPVDDHNEVAQVQAHLQRVADAHGKQLTAFATNLKTVESAYTTNWILNYGCALATLGHLLDGRYREILISAGLTYQNRMVTGSHPVTDPLLGSRGLRFVHDGAAFNRMEKTLRIADAGAPLHALRVCWESRRHDNCSRCRKCLLTMVTLDLAGYRDRANCFDWSGYSVDSLRSVFVDGEVQDIFFHEVLAEARRRGRSDIVDVVAGILEASSRISRIGEKVRRTPLLWHFDYQITRYLRHRHFGKD